MGRKRQLRAIDFFSGAGGLTYGLRVAGINVIAGIDNDESCKKTYEINNSGSLYLAKDISLYKPAQLARELKLSKNDNHMIFAGCAPCQFWTAINTSKEKSHKGKNLVLDFLRFIKYFRPGYVIAENVPGVLYKKDSPMALFINALERIGYNVAHDVTDMSEYGLPQRRRRFTLLASRISKIALPKVRKIRRTVRDTIGVRNGFPKIDAGARDTSLFLHTASGLSKTNLKRIKLTKHNGGDRSRWQNDKHLQLPCYSTGTMKFSDTYGRMWWDRPAPTITTKFFSISNGRFAHPDENRAISLREGATLQSFPRKYRFIGESIESIAKMIGNAVPPKFATILGRHVVNQAFSCEG